MFDDFFEEVFCDIEDKVISPTGYRQSNFTPFSSQRGPNTGYTGLETLTEHIYDDFFLFDTCMLDYVDTYISGGNVR